MVKLSFSLMILEKLITFLLQDNHNHLCSFILAVSNWTSRAPLLFFLTLELEANKTLQPGKEVKGNTC